MTETEVQTPENPESTPESRPSTPPDDSAGAQLGNVLIVASVGLLAVLAIGIGLTQSRSGHGGEELPPRDAELEFAENRRDWNSSDFEDVAWNDDECEWVETAIDDGDAEARFAGDDTRSLERELCGRSGLFPDEEPRRLRRGDLVLRTDLTRDTRRVRELRVEFGAGRDPIELGVATSERLRQNYNGIAVRTERSAALLRNDYLVAIERPRGCDDGCEITVWLTMGPEFAELHPDAELYVYGDRRTDIDVDELRELPRNAYN